jgi:TonB family protein
MHSPKICEELDRAIDLMIADPSASLSCIDPEVAELMIIAADLRHISRPAFRAELRTALVGQVFLSGTPAMPPISSRRTEEVLPTLFGTENGTYGVHRVNFLASALIHTAALALITTSAFWMTSRQDSVKLDQAVALVQPDARELFTISKTTTGGGGGGGDRDKAPAPTGHLPKQADRQFTPPTMITHNDHPLLPMQSTVVAPQINLAANMPNLGDPLSKVIGPPSNGTGSNGGLGSGSGGGVGYGYGAGVGPGYGGGFGGGVYRVGGGVSAPRIIYDPDPLYSEEARKAKYQGTVVLWAVIGSNGRPQELRVARALGLGLDQQAIEAVRKWRFEPAMKDGHPVAVQINIEVNFRLY